MIRNKTTSGMDWDTLKDNPTFAQDTMDPVG